MPTETQSWKKACRAQTSLNFNSDLAPKFWSSYLSFVLSSIHSSGGLLQKARKQKCICHGLIWYCNPWQMSFWIQITTLTHWCSLRIFSDYVTFISTKLGNRVCNRTRLVWEDKNHPDSSRHLLHCCTSDLDHFFLSPPFHLSHL